MLLFKYNKGAKNMRKYIEQFIKDLEKKISNKHKFSNKEIIVIKDKIAFFQHERLIHLLVTLFYAIFTLTFLALSLVSIIFLIPFIIEIIFILFYIRHYFFLENAVQYIYTLYDKIIKDFEP